MANGHTPPVGGTYHAWTGDRWAGRGRRDALRAALEDAGLAGVALGEARRALGRTLDADADVWEEGRGELDTARYHLQQAAALLAAAERAATYAEVWA